MTHSFPTRRSSDLPLNLIDGRDLRWRILRFETELDLGHRSALPYLPPLNSEVSQLINLSFCLFEHLATELREILIHVGRYAQRSTRSEEHTSELQSLMRISYAVFCLKKKTIPISHELSPPLH